MCFFPAILSPSYFLAIMSPIRVFWLSDFMIEIREMGTHGRDRRNEQEAETDLSIGQ